MPPQSEVEINAENEAAKFVQVFNEVFLTPLILLLTAIAVLVFIYGAFGYVTNAENEQARADGKKHMLFGIIGIVIMISAYAILWLFANTFGIAGELDRLDGITR